ncbi:MAG: glycoside hydrolase family 95 protein, partial [Candidatus Aminicenantes bacterium]|nr:glycoside hydrolase family 95 protein [Candidatus Aminicenantes bacterium]
MNQTCGEKGRKVTREKRRAVAGLMPLLFLLLFSCRGKTGVPTFKSGPADLVFPHLAERWDEGIPLGNGVLGGILWSREGRMRLAVDRIDLWDLRLQEEMHGPD